MLYIISRKAGAEHGVEDSFAGDAIADEEDLSVEVCLQTINVLSPPQT